MKIAARVFRRRRWLDRLLALGAVGLSVGSIAVGAGMIGTGLAVCAAAAMTVGIVRRWVGRPQSVILDDESLSIGAARLKLGHIKKARIETDASTSILVLHDRRGSVWRLSLQRDQANAILERIDLAPERRSLQLLRREKDTSQFLGIVGGWLMAGVAVVGFSFVNFRSPAGILPASVIAGVAAVLLLRRWFGYSPVVVDSDGLRWRDRGREHFVAYREIRSIKRGRIRGQFKSLVVRTDDGDLEIDVRDVPEDLLVLTIEQVTDLLGREPPVVLESLARNGESLVGWRARLRRLFDDEVYRGMPVPRVRVEEALDDPHCAPERRLGAALALIASSDSSGERAIRARVAELAEIVADPSLAEAFEELGTRELRERTVEKLCS